MVMGKEMTIKTIGKPLLKSTIKQFEEIERYELISFEAYIIASLMTLFIEPPKPWYIRLFNKMKRTK